MDNKTYSTQQCANETLKQMFLCNLCENDDWTFSQKEFRSCSSECSYKRDAVSTREPCILIRVPPRNINEQTKEIINYSTQYLLEYTASYRTTEELRCKSCGAEVYYNIQTTRYPNTVVVLSIPRWDYRPKSTRLRMRVELSLEISIESESFVLIGAIYHKGRILFSSITKSHIYIIYHCYRKINDVWTFQKSRKFRESRQFEAIFYCR
jgi:hypothetical protein